jgi:hypothetical protein
MRGKVARIKKGECELVANQTVPLETQRISQFGPTCSGKATMLDRIDLLVGTSETLRMVRTVRAMVPLAEAPVVRTREPSSSRRMLRGPVYRIDK